MAKATINLENGTKIVIEGSIDEIHKIINLHDDLPNFLQREPLNFLQTEPPDFL